MPFSPDTKNPGDLIKSLDWNDAMTAIVTLFERLDGSLGHKHSGGPEDGPQIGTDGIQDNAVNGQKIAPNSINAGHLAANSVGGSEIVNGSVTVNELAINAVSNSRIQNFAVNGNKLSTNAVSTSKILNGAVTAAKIASGVIPDIGIVYAPSVSDGQTIPRPSGFTASETIYYAALKTVSIATTGSGATRIVKVNVNQSTGAVSFVDLNNTNGGGEAVGLALSKKGGW